MLGLSYETHTSIRNSCPRSRFFCFNPIRIGRISLGANFARFAHREGVPSLFSWITWEFGTATLRTTVATTNIRHRDEARIVKIGKIQLQDQLRKEREGGWWLWRIPLPLGNLKVLYLGLTRIRRKFEVLWHIAAVSSYRWSRWSLS